MLPGGLLHASEAGIEGHGYVVPEVASAEFLEFLELKYEFGQV